MPNLSWVLKHLHPENHSKHNTAVKMSSLLNSALTDHRWNSFFLGNWDKDIKVQLYPRASCFSEAVVFFFQTWSSNTSTLPHDWVTYHLFYSIPIFLPLSYHQWSNLPFNHQPVWLLNNPSWAFIASRMNYGKWLEVNNRQVCKTQITTTTTSPWRKIVFHETSPWCQKGWGLLL